VVGALGWGAASEGMRAPGLSALAACLCVAGCGASRIPAALRGYDILVEQAADPQAAELARAMRAYGFRVRRAVQGGNRPTAALISFTFQETGPGTAPWLYLRLANTRTGEIVGAAMIPLDSVGPTPRARADAAVRALVAAPLATPP
jgi:hypothetical protein